MPQAKIVGTRTLWACGRCGLLYPDVVTAQACEDYCTAHNACSMEIAKRAIRD